MVSPAQELSLRGALGWEDTRVSGCFLRSWEGGSQQGPEKHLLPPKKGAGRWLLGHGMAEGQGGMS